MVSADPRLVVIPSDWGHLGEFLLHTNSGGSPTQNVSALAGGGANPADDEFIKETVRKFFES